MIDLCGTWDLSDTTGGRRVPMRVPGDVHTALFEAGLIPDPYHGRNEYELRGIADEDWILTRSVTLPPDHGHWLLVAESLDTIAEVRVNGRLVLQAETSFREQVADVGAALVEGENRIEIRLGSPTRAADARQAAQPFPVPYHAGNCPIPNGNMLRKPQCDFGWDWNVALAPLGVTGGIRLVGPEGEIADVRILQRHGDGAVRLSVEGRLRGAADPDVGWRVEIAGAVAEGRGPDIAAELRLDHPALWWPAGLGAPTLHPLTVTAGGAVFRQEIALREITLVSEPDETGRSFGLRVNGRDVFCRGANWIPADALAGRISRKKTRALLQSAADANMNMIRVWGGGRYEPDDFYADCDALGLMVWQDFMYSCHLYPATEAFLAEAERETTFQARRLAHRVALWCGDNELLGALTWFKESVENRDRYIVAYDRLNRTVEQALKRALPGAVWWPSSPSPGPLSFGDTWHDDTSGDMHFWSVWHEGRDFEHYRDVRPRFCSEFGFQSYSSMDVIRSFADPADLNIASPVMESHQKNAGGNARIAETMFRYFRFPNDFEGFVWLSQVQQGLAIRTAVDFWRSLKPHCMGALYWQLNDTWPVASWSSLDHGGGWKLLHHMARRFFQPVTVTLIPDRTGDLVATAVNDTAEPVDVEVVFHAVRLDGSRRPLPGRAVGVGTTAAARVCTIPAGSLAAGELVAFRWRASNGMAGGDLLPPVRHKALDLPDPKLRLETRVGDGRIVARVTADAVAFFVTLEADRPGRFSDNAFAMLPADDVEIVFVPDRGDAADVRLTLRDLHSSTTRPA